jgi:uncharacterized protein (TIGR00269 family)
VNVKEEMGFDMDDVHRLGQKIHHRKSLSGSPMHFRGDCSYCGLIKRYYINRFATLNNFTKVATGHNLTDEATQLVSNFFNLDMELMSRTGPVTSTDVDGLVPRIKPLYFIYEQETMLYAYYAKIEHISTECEYAEDSPNVTLKKSLEHIESFRRATMMNMMLKYQKDLKPLFSHTIPAEKLIARRCTHCNMPTYLEVCAFCKTKDRLLQLLKESPSLLQ